MLGVFDDMTFTCQLTAPVGDTQFEYRLAKNGENVSISDQNKVRRVVCAWRGEEKGCPSLYIVYCMLYTV